MEFEKSRVYTAVNADELPIGSRCVFADTIHDLRKKVESDSVQRHVYVLRAVRDGCEKERFEEDVNTTFLLAYLIEPPSKPKYRPFESVEKAMEAIKKHGGWVGYKCFSFLVTAYDKARPDHAVCFSDNWYSLQDLYKSFVFADDGSPCGELDEE